MAQSILIVKYNLPLSIGEIFRKLDKKKFKIKYDDENNQDKKIELEQEISNLKRNNFGVEGYVKYYYQKENATHPKTLQYIRIDVQYNYHNSSHI